MTAIGVLSIDEVSTVDPGDLTDSDARASGHDDLRSLRRSLSNRTQGTIYRIALHYAGPDPRISLRAALPDRAELEQLRLRMVRWDAASASGPWTRSVMRLLGKRVGVRAADLAATVGMDTPRFKANVRKLKGLGLTESLDVGYRLSPRGQAFLRARGS